MPNSAARCWLIAIDEIADEAWVSIGGCLSQAERERAGRFRLPADRRRFIAARTLLRRILGAELGERAADVSLAIGPAGKPSLPGSPIQFNLSHSGRFVVIALSRTCAVGVDVEEIRPRVDFAGIARRFFHPGELADLVSLPEGEALDAFYRCWTRKEAIVKALGLGLGLPLSSFRVSCLPGVPPRLLTVAEEGLKAGLAPDWSICGLDPGSGYAAALASAMPALEGQLEILRWDSAEASAALLDS